MDREKLLKHLDKAWSELRASVAGLSEDELTKKGVVEDWSIKDILAHVTTWEEEALKHLPHIMAGGRPPRYSVTYGGIDAFNALQTEENRSRSLVEVMGRFEDIHRQLVEYIHSVPEALIADETRFRRRLRLDTYSHYPIHTRSILAWREQQGLLLRKEEAGS